MAPSTCATWARSRLVGSVGDPQAEGGGGSCSNANNNSVNNTSSCYASELGQEQLGHGGASVVDVGGGERKPTRAQLVVHDAGSLASVVSIGSSRSMDQQQQQISNINFGMMDHLDFDAYNNDDPAGIGGFGGAGGFGDVSLTLGLKQHANDDPHGGVNIAFASTAPSAAHEFQFMAGGGEHEQQMVAGGGAVHTSHGHGHHGQFSAAGMQGDGVSSSHYHHRGLSAATGFQLLPGLTG